MPKNLREQYDAVASMLYNIDESIGVIYSSIDDFREITEMVVNPYIPEQLVDLGYIIITSQSVSHSNLHWWIRCPPAD